MKRTLTVMASNWLRKPENQQKIKRAARRLWAKYQQRKGRSPKSQRSPDRPGNRH